MKNIIKLLLCIVLCIWLVWSNIFVNAEEIFPYGSDEWGDMKFDPWAQDVNTKFKWITKQIWDEYLEAKSASGKYIENAEKEGLSLYIQTVVKYFIGFTAIIATIVLLYWFAGVLSPKWEKWLESAMKYITWAIIALIIIWLAWLFVMWVFSVYSDIQLKATA